MKASNKKRCLADIYLKGYPYKKNYPFDPKTIPQPYIKKEEVSSHQYATDYHLFKDVVHGYLDYITENLIEGNAWRLDFGLGEIRIKKVPIKFLRERIVNKRIDDKLYFRNNNEGNFFLTPRWHRRSIQVKLVYNWIFQVSRSVIKECYVRGSKDYTHLYKYQDI